MASLARAQKAAHSSPRLTRRISTKNLG